MEDRAANLSESEVNSSRKLSETTLVGPPSNPTDPAEKTGSDGGPDKSLRTIFGDFTLAHEDIVLTEATAEVPSVTVRPEQVVADGSSTMLVFSVFGDGFDEFESTLEETETISDLVLLNRDSENRCYRGTFAEGAVTISPILTRIGARVIDVVGSGGDWDVRGQFRSRETFLRFRNYCAENGISFRLHRLCWDDGGSDWRRNGLTPEQWDALQQAYKAGYFDVPRDISQSELAEKLGVSPSAVSQRLRRATSQLIEEQLDTDDS